jgi:hypothetical protein
MPKLAKGQISALKDEASGGKTWIGDPSLGAVIPEPPTERPPGEDWFLQLTGWDQSDPNVDPNLVTATSENRHPTLDASFYNGALQGGRPWYYAEYLNVQELYGLVRTKPDQLFQLVNKLRPSLVVYHFFYPLHEEPLRGCETAGAGQKFATFAGGWTSVAVLLDSNEAPLFIGVTSRNVGDPTSIPAEENRIGMIAEPWQKVDRVGDHPKIFVSRGTHGNYLRTGPHALKPFTPGDIDLNQGTCAQIEKLDDVISGGEASAIPGREPTGNIVLGSLLSFFSIGIVALFWDWGAFGEFIPALEPNENPQDETGGPLFGLILRPEKLFVSEQAAAQHTEDWQTKMPDPTDNPRYDFVVDRETQFWWPPREASLGYAGRWGPRVTNDPNARRSGMRCPPFALLFLEGIAKL